MTKDNPERTDRIGSNSADIRVAVLSDTHGLMRDSVLAHLEGVAHILHGGDVGDPAILDVLRSFAPVTAIRGNIDRTGVCALLPPVELVTVAGVTVYMLHDLDDLDIEPLAAGVQLVISGHSHKPSLQERRGVTYLNPGSVGPRRFHLPISMALLHICSGSFRVEFLTLAE